MFFSIHPYIFSVLCFAFVENKNRYDFMMGKIDKYHWVDLGSSYVPNELSCAVLWAQLEQANSIGERRIANFNVYLNGLKELADAGAFRIPIIPEGCCTNAHIFYMLFASVGLRQYYEAELKKRGISAFTHYVALHSAPAGLKYGRSVGCMDVTNEIQHVLLRLPVWIDMTAAQVQFVLESVKEIAASAPKA
jgi:dTDP-4-amino-4,6-dideoxygalactose transaminase